MDGLWDPPYDEASEDTLSFSLPYDVIENTAINERCCIQVLEILMSKADTEIVEHEEVLLDLLSQLACTDELFSDMFLMSLREKIDFLDSSIRKSKDDAEGFWSTSRQPAESIFDILKSIFCLYIQKKDLQFADNTSGTTSSSYCQVPVDTRKKQIGSSSITNQMEKIRTVNVTPVDIQTISKTIVKVEEEHTGYPHMSPAPKYSPLSLRWGSKKKTDREVKKFQMKNPIIMKKDILQKRTPRCTSICLKPPLETQGRWRRQLSVIKSQSYDERMSLATVPYDTRVSLATVPYDKTMSLATVPYDENMCLAPVPYNESTSLETTSYDKRLSLATVPYLDSSEETNGLSLVTISYEEANTKQNIIKELDFPPGYPKPQHHQKQSISRSRSPYSTQTYKRRKKPDSPPQTSSASRLALVVAPLASQTRNLCMEDYYTVSDLRSIAKQQKVKGYYKLRKAELAQLLGIKLIEGRRKQPPQRKALQLLPMIKCEP